MRIELIPDRNVLRLTLRPGAVAVGPPETATATIDVGERGSLLGIELPADDRLIAPWRAGAAGSAAAYDPTSGSLAMALVPDASGPHVRTVEATVALHRDRAGGLVALDLPRRGAGYEIAYPSGNQ